MTTPRHRFQPAAWLQRSRIPLLATLPVFIVGATLWMLSIKQIIDPSWSSMVGALFTVFGTLLALLQWQLPPSPKRKGALHVKVGKSLCGQTVRVYHGFVLTLAHPGAAANVNEHMKRGHRTFIAVFRTLEPGNYTVAIEPYRLLSYITISAGHIAIIDWRYLSLQRKKDVHS